ncbi:hemolymph lipopolysaccharide-binding protein [Anabrus simplex]|uniref:hemolymph lipopolysaccharide-binding protein n=1 Tax=Anabrus simplex TaxID=316456 RepID=UPI0035A2A59B
MLFSMSYVIVMALLAVEGSKASTCSSNEEIFHFSISNKKNSSLHRTFQVDVMKNTVGNANGTGEISLDVAHGRTLCNNSELVRMSTSVSVLEPPITIVDTPFGRDDYELFPSIGYYKLHTTVQLWEAAREICVREGAHLIVINSDAEATVVKEYFSRNPTFSGSSSASYVYAGFHDKYTEGDFVTVTGISLSKTGYMKWSSGQPNGGSIDNFGGLDNQGLLMDIEDTWRLGFICEKEL